MVNLKHLPTQIQTEIQQALHEAARDPARRSEILGNAALHLAARSQRPQHGREAPMLRALAEQIAEAAITWRPGPATVDDFEEQLEEFDQAHAAHDDDLDVLARAEDLHDQRTNNKHGERVSIAPLSWGAGATLGRTGRFKYNPTTDEVSQNISQAATLAYWQGEPYEAQAITIDLALAADGRPLPVTSLPSPSTNLPDTSSRPYGIVSFGSDGAITKVKFDAGFGARLTVTGNYVAVVAGMDPPRTGAAPGMLPLACSMGAFASPSMAPLFLTEYIDDLAVGVRTGPIQRPMHATQLLAVLSTAVGGAADLTFWGQGATQLLMRVSYPVGSFFPAIPLPSEVQYVALQNLAGETANYRLVFQLSL